MKSVKFCYHCQHLSVIFFQLFNIEYVSQEEVAKEFGIPVQFQRFWLWARRQNHTYRPNRPLSPQEEAQSVSNNILALEFSIAGLNR